MNKRIYTVNVQLILYEYFKAEECQNLLISSIFKA